MEGLNVIDTSHFCLFVCSFVLFVFSCLLFCLLLFLVLFVFTFLDFWDGGMGVEALVRKILGFVGGAEHYNFCWPEYFGSLLVWLEGCEIQNCNLPVLEN